MLKVRVIPTLLYKSTGLVKGVGFDSWRRVGPVLPAIKVYNARDVDELVFLDITASLDGDEPDYEIIADFSANCMVPLTVGGGVSKLEHIDGLLRAGADKVSINSAAYATPAFVARAAERFGSQCIVASIDAKCLGAGEWRCFGHAGSMDSGRAPAPWAAELAQLGAGEILLTSIDRDGTMQGYDLDLVKAVVDAVEIPVIASGGAGSYTHMAEVILRSGASAVAAASMFHFTEQVPLGARQHLAEAGIPVRKHFARPDAA